MMTAIQETKLAKRRDRNLRAQAIAKASAASKPKCKEPEKKSAQYTLWFAKLPFKDRAAIKKAYDQAKAMKNNPPLGF